MTVAEAIKNLEDIRDKATDSSVKKTITEQLVKLKRYMRAPGVGPKGEVSQEVSDRIEKFSRASRLDNDEPNDYWANELVIALYKMYNSMGKTEDIDKKTEEDIDKNNESKTENDRAKTKNNGSRTSWFKQHIDVLFAVLGLVLGLVVAYCIPNLRNQQDAVYFVVESVKDIAGALVGGAAAFGAFHGVKYIIKSRAAFSFKLKNDNKSIEVKYVGMRIYNGVPDEEMCKKIGIADLADPYRQAKLFAGAYADYMGAKISSGNETPFLQGLVGETVSGDILQFDQDGFSRWLDEQRDLEQMSAMQPGEDKLQKLIEKYSAKSTRKKALNFYKIAKNVCKKNKDYSAAAIKDHLKDALSEMFGKSDDSLFGLFETDAATPMDWYFGYIITDAEGKKVTTTDAKNRKKTTADDDSPFEMFMESNSDGTYNICLVISDWNKKASRLFDDNEKADNKKVDGQNVNNSKDNEEKAKSSEFKLYEYDTVTVSGVPYNPNDGGVENVNLNRQYSISFNDFGAGNYRDEGGKITLRKRIRDKGSSENRDKGKIVPLKISFKSKDDKKTPCEFFIRYMCFRKCEISYRLKRKIKKKNNYLYYRFKNIPDVGVLLRYKLDDTRDIPNTLFYNSRRMKNLGRVSESNIDDVFKNFSFTFVDENKYNKYYIVRETEWKPEKRALSKRNMRCPYCGKLLALTKENAQKGSCTCSGSKVENKSQNRVFCDRNRLFAADKNGSVTLGGGITSKGNPVSFKLDESIREHTLYLPSGFEDGRNATISFLAGPRVGKSTFIARMLNVIRQNKSNNIDKKITIDTKLSNLTNFLPQRDRLHDVRCYFPDVTWEDIFVGLNGKFGKTDSSDKPEDPITYKDYSSEVFSSDVEQTNSSDWKVDFLRNFPFILQLDENFLSFYDVPGEKLKNKKEFLGNWDNDHPLFHSDAIIVMMDPFEGRNVEVLKDWLQSIRKEYDANNQKIAIAVLLCKFDLLYDEIPSNSYLKKSMPIVDANSRYDGSLFQKTIDKCSELVREYIKSISINGSTYTESIKILDKLSEDMPVKYFAVSSVGRGKSIYGEGNMHLYNVEPMGIENALIWLSYQLGVIE